MIILLPFKENSERTPYKNLFLLPFTLHFLEQENIDLNCVYTYGQISDKTKKDLDKISEHITGRTIKHIQVDDENADNHKAATAYALDALKLEDSEPVIMLQLTNPKREKGLIQRAVDAVKKDPDLGVVSGIRVDCKKRRLSASGYLLNDTNLMIYDGAIYAGTKTSLLSVFNMQEEHTVVQNGSFSVADIDYPSDILKSFDIK